jgi:hypothetical protein
MRTTQWIGLTANAKVFVGNLEILESDTYAIGMFEEEIPLKKWVTPQGKIVREVVQTAPWSSGPMIFTYLTIDGEKKYQWIEDISMKGREYDYETGLFYV